MPKSTNRKPQQPLTSAEKETLKNWITGTGTRVDKRDFITQTKSVEWMRSDITSLKERGALSKTVRYLNLANIYNKRDATNRPEIPLSLIQDYHFSVSKLLNSLSWSKEIVVPKVVDSYGTLLRFDLADYGIDARIWERLFAGYPYHILTGDSNLSADEFFGSHPLMRADFFVFAMAQPPFYHMALRLPGGENLINADTELERKLGIGADKAIFDERTVRAGFQKSGVSQGNRVIERFPLDPDNGYFWKSYDFDPDRQNERGGDLFRSPLGPGTMSLTMDPQLRFSHDGGEIIFSLPNGLQAYLLTDGRGARIDEGPTNIVADASRPDGRIINGISCMSCHREGLVSAGVSDEVLQQSKTIALPAPERKKIERLYDSVRLKNWLVSDTERYCEALGKCGSYSGKTEAVRLLYDAFKADLYPRDLGPEIGLDSSEILNRLDRSSSPGVKFIVSKFRSATPVPRLDFEKELPAIVEALGLGTVQATYELGLVEFGGLVDPNSGAIQGESATHITVRGEAKIINPIRLPLYDDKRNISRPVQAPSIEPSRRSYGVEGTATPVRLPEYDRKPSGFHQVPKP